MPTRGRGCNRLAALLVVALLAGPGGSLAQSGRNREKPLPEARPAPGQPAPGAPPATAPAEPAPEPARAVPRELQVARQDDHGATTRFVLRNGLTVVVAENHAIPVASVVVAVRAGDPPGRAGLSEMTARMLAHGGPGRPAATSRVRAVGGELSAGADGEIASLTAVVPRSAVDVTVGALLDAVLAPAFDEAELRAEAAAVARAAAAEGPEELGERRALEAVFNSSETPAARPITRDELVAFHAERYTPSSTLIVVAGDVSIFDVLARVQQAYSPKAPVATPSRGARGAPTPRPQPAPPASEPAPPRAPAGVQAAASGPRYLSDRVDAGLAVVTIAYPAPPLTVAGAAVPSIVVAALGQGRASRLARALHGQGFAGSVSAKYVATRSAGALVFRFSVDPKQIDAAEAAFFREIDRFRREVLSEGELQRARNQIERQRVEAAAGLSARARSLVASQFDFGDFRAGEQAVEHARGVTAEALQTAVAPMLSAARVVVHEALPQQAPPRAFTAGQYAATIAAWAPGALRDVGPGEARHGVDVAALPEGRERGRQGIAGDAVIAPLPQPVRDFSTLNGARALVREDQSRPTVSIGLIFGGGRLLEAPEQAGLTELLLRSMLGRTRGDADRVLEIEQLGGEITLVNEPDFFGIVVDVLSRNADAAMRALIDLTENPAFVKEEVDRERELMLAELRDRRAEPGREGELFWANRLPGHPYALGPLGTPGSVAKFSIETVNARHREVVKVQYPFVVIVGDTDGSSLISRHVAEGFERDDPQDTVRVLKPHPPAQESEGVETRDWRATAQAIGFLTEGGAGAAADALELAAEVASQRLARELTDRQVPVLEAYVVTEPRRLAGAVVARVTSAPGDEPRAREAVMAAFARTASLQAASEELQTARDALAARQAASLRPHRARLVEYARMAYLGAPLDWLDSQSSRLRTISAETVQTLAGATFVPSRAGRGIVRGRG